MLPTSSSSDVGLGVRENPRATLTALGRWAFFWALFVGIGAVAGTLMMWLAPDTFGMTPLLADMQVLPLAGVFFGSLAWPGAFLLALVAIPNLFTAWLVLRRHPRAPWAALACGLVLLAWIALQLLVVFGPNPISNVYLVFAVAQTLVAVLWLRATAGVRASARAT